VQFRRTIVNILNVQRWLIVGVVFLAAAITVGPVYAFGLFIGPLENDFGWQRTAISASLSFAAIGAVAAPFIGRVMDRYGANVVMAGSLTIMGTSFILRPFMTELWHWYGLSFFQYIAVAGCAGLPTGRLVGMWFTKTKGRIMGIAMMGNNFGGVIIPLITGFFLATGDWKSAFVILGVLSYAIALISIIVVREHSNNAPYEPQPDKQNKKSTLTGVTLREALRSKSIYLMTLALMAGSFTYGSILPQIGAHLEAEKMPSTLIPLAISLLATFGMLGKVVFGYLSERISARRTLMISLTGQILFIWLIVTYPLPPAIWVEVCLFGFFMGAYGALITLVVQEYFGLKHFGSIFGLVSMGSVVPFFAGPLLAGASFDITGSYAPAFLTTAILFSISLILLWQMAPAKHINE